MSIKKAVEGPAPLETRCTAAQESAADLVRKQMDRSRERLGKKGVVPFFMFELYVINCGAHEMPGTDPELPPAPASMLHVALVNTALTELQPEGLQHAIAATEAMLAKLKERLA